MVIQQVAEVRRLPYHWPRIHYRQVYTTMRSAALQIAYTDEAGLGAARWLGLNVSNIQLSDPESKVTSEAGRCGSSPPRRLGQLPRHDQASLSSNPAIPSSPENRTTWRHNCFASAAPLAVKYRPG